MTSRMRVTFASGERRENITETRTEPHLTKSEQFFLVSLKALLAKNHCILQNFLNKTSVGYLFSLLFFFLQENFHEQPED